MLARAIGGGEMPAHLKEHGLFWQAGAGTNTDDLMKAGALAAAQIVVICPDVHMDGADDLTEAVVHRLRKMGVKCPIVVEVVSDNNRATIREEGATGMVRPTHHNPALLVKALAAPGIEDVLEGFTLNGHGADVNDVHVSVPSMPWQDAAIRILKSGCGTLVGYVDNTGAVHQIGTSHINRAVRLFIAAGEGQHPTPDSVQKALGLAA